YVIPVDVYEVRPQDMDKPALAIVALPERSNDYFKHETADAQAQEEALLKVVSARSDANLGMIKLALNLIKWYHGHKNRHSGEPFYLHPLAVAQIVMDYNQDEATIVGALLHDTVEDTPMLMGHIEALFGKETAEVVDLVTHLQSIPGSMYKVKLSAEENLRMLGNTKNKRGLYVKLADRMHNMRTINGHPKVSKRKLVARETMDFFVPLAEKLGLKEAAQEFKERCEKVLKMKE
ncbi:MAG: HD domain-containing protein, partial [Bacteroidota bacterium]